VKEEGIVNNKDISSTAVPALTLVTMLSFASSSYAGNSTTMQSVSAVPDSMLAEMRGKYVASATQVVYFGVMMQSNWQTPDGSLLSAGANVVVDLSNSAPSVSFIPTANVALSGNGDASQFVDTSGREATSSGLGNVSGITQSVQVAGDYNATHNLVRVNFLSGVPLDEALTTDLTRASANASIGDVGLSGYSAIDDNSVTVHLEVDGQGVAEQSIRGTVFGASGKGVSQSIVALGDRQQIMNQLDMNVVVRQDSATKVLRQGLGSALGSLRGIAPNL